MSLKNVKRGPLFTGKTFEEFLNGFKALRDTVGGWVPFDPDDEDYIPVLQTEGLLVVVIARIWGKLNIHTAIVGVLIQSNGGMAMTVGEDIYPLAAWFTPEDLETLRGLPEALKEAGFSEVAPWLENVG